jgi:hypothetical protein
VCPYCTDDDVVRLDGDRRALVGLDRLDGVAACSLETPGQVRLSQPLAFGQIVQDAGC